MLVDVKRNLIKKQKENQITSHIIFKPHRRQSPENLKFHEEGIFSKTIFGNFNKCDCGKVTNEGFCENCETRVINPKNMPEFYIDLTIQTLVSFPDFELLSIQKDDIINIMSYEKFLYDGEIRELDENLDISEFDQSKVFIGIKALKELGIDEKWIKENTTDYLSIPHTSYRPIVIDGGDSPFITNINLLYSDIILNINNAIEMHEFTKERPFYLMSEYKVIVRLYNKIINSLFDELQNVKHSILKSEIISHPISGAIRAVLTNRHDIDEDILIIGDTLIETLFPYLFKKYQGDVILINKYLIDNDYLVLLNRPPTISHLSTIAMKPRIASLYPFGKTENTDNCLLQNEKYINENKDKIGLIKSLDKNGDIERFGQGIKDGIDTMGLRCISMNPLSFDGLGADTDGDVLLVIALYSKIALQQAKEILPSNSYMNYANGTIRNHIIEDFVFIGDKDNIKEGINQYKNLSRKEYTNKNQELSKNLWLQEKSPTVGDIADFINKKGNTNLEAVFDFFDNKKEFVQMANRTDNNYCQEESSSFIRKVMSANNEDISKAGYFYKLLMASADDFCIISEDCESNGIIYDIENITKEIYNYKIKSMFINEFSEYCILDYKEFIQKCNCENIKEIHVRTPLSCNKKEKHGICRKCAGILPKNINNIGTFMTLMVTEHATQAALSSMNKGRKENINELISSKYNGSYDWNEIIKWIIEIVDLLENENVASRFYEIALLSRVRIDNQNPFVASLKGSINYSNNLFGTYIFNSNIKNFEKIIRQKTFNDDSLKLQIAMNNYNKK